MSQSDLTPEKEVVVSGPELALDMLHQGFATLVAATATVAAGGASYTQPEVLLAIDALRTLLRGERESKIAYRERRAARLAKDEEIRRKIRDLQAAVRSILGDANPKLVQFGLVPKGARRELTAAENVLRAEKARRTREVRHTLGPKQKALLRGADVTSVVVARPAPPGTSGTGGTTPTRIPA